MRREDPAGDGVTTVRWPSGAARRAALAQEGRACLLLVEAGEAPPASWGVLEDWTRDGADAIELLVRAESLRRRLAGRTPPVLDDDGLVWRGGRWAALTPIEMRAAVPLLARPGSGVGRAELLALVAPGCVADDRRTVDRVVRQLRRRLAPLGLRIHAVRGTGFLLEAGPLPA